MILSHADVTAVVISQYRVIVESGILISFNFRDDWILPSKICCNLILYIYIYIYIFNFYVHLLLILSTLQRSVPFDFHP